MQAGALYPDTETNERKGRRFNLVRLVQAFGLAAVIGFPALASAQTTFQSAFERGQGLLDQFDLDGARAAFEVAQVTATTAVQRAQVLDRLGAVDGIDAKYWSAFRRFFRAAIDGGPESVKSLEHPQIPTRRMARCAVRFERAGRSLQEAEDMIREALGAAPDEDLDGLLAAALFAEEFACPELETEPLVGTKDAPPTGVVLTQADPGFFRPPPLGTWILSGTSVAALGTGIALFVTARGQAEDAAPPTFQSDIDSAEGLLIGSNVAFAVAGGAAAGALLWWFLDGGLGEQGGREPPAALLTSEGFRVRF